MSTVSQTLTAPSEFDALVVVAQREHTARRLDAAAAAYRKILALRPDVAEAYNNLGGVLKDQGQLDEAAAQYERAVALKPGLFPAHVQPGRYLPGAGQARPGSGRYRQAIALRPGDAAVYHSLGSVLLGNRASSTSPPPNSSEPWRSIPNCSIRTSPWAASFTSRVSSTRPWHGSNARSPSDRTSPKATTAWATCLRKQDKARRGQGRVRAGDPAQARPLSRAQQPGLRLARPGQARPGRGQLRSGAGHQPALPLVAHQPRQRTEESKANSTRPWPATTGPWPSSPTSPARITIARISRPFAGRCRSRRARNACRQR